MRKGVSEQSFEDPDLAKIIEIWPSLSDELRKAIVKMIS